MESVNEAKINGRGERIRTSDLPETRHAACSGRSKYYCGKQ